MSYKPQIKIAVSGALLGGLLAIVGIFFVQVNKVLGIPATTGYLTFAVAPLVYAFVWRWAVDSLNDMMGIRS